MDNSAKNLYDTLVTKNLDPEALDTMGKPVDDPEDANLFSFDWKTNNTNYGTVVVLLGENNTLEIYFGDSIGQTMEGDDKKQWYDFLEQMKNFATRNLLSFNVKNLNRLKYTMKGMAAIKEGLFEGYYGTRKMSYSDQPKAVKLVIKHNKTLGEGDARFRYIESLFVETADGERFKVPTRSLTHGKMVARHVAEGGTPYDIFGQHINDVVKEINTLGKFLRVAKAKKFGDEGQSMIESAIRHYNDLKAKAKRMISKRGYQEEKENFDPASFSDSEIAVEAIRDMFVEQNIDTRIEEALPVLARIGASMAADALINKNDPAVQFENWANNITEGTWALPDTPEKLSKLKKLMSQPLPVGPDAMNATEVLYDLLGDDKLFDQLGDLSTSDPDADSRSLINNRLKDLDIDLGIDISNLPEDLDSDGVMMTRPSNMSS